ncbi:hypothetical protein CXB51_014415 [Gossypium anomalum]|uniref:Uncharacterized protein n=1 Tax=Gossypium anomalum TaxID=47600 RepID=A0A8J5Z3I7_9ROSI|nr:hypothetical protein CXB51_014415 [Gossypium anomalum]
MHLSETEYDPYLQNVNNVGTINKNNRIWEVPVEEFEIVIDVNLKGIANALCHFISIIINMSSGWGRSGAALVVPYCASKWAVEGLNRALTKEMPCGFVVVAHSPGVINIEMLQSCFGNSALGYQTPDAWSLKAATMILNLTARNNGVSLTV